MRAVSIPPHRYADFAQEIFTTHSQGGNGSGQARMLAKSTRAYTRVVLRLRAQAEAEHEYLHSQLKTASVDGCSSNHGHQFTRGYNSPSSYPSPARTPSRPASRAGSAVSSHDHDVFSTHSHSRPSLYSRNTPPHLKPKFRSPLYKPHHAPLLRVFVLSPDGPWLSDATIMECEKELKRSCTGAKGRLSKGLLKIGDIVWNCSVGDEANLGRSIWDGNYLIVRVTGISYILCLT